MKKPNIKAFSLVEITIVILVIGVIIAGVLASNVLIKKFRIATAQNLTQSSPIQGIADSVLWLETSLDKSFKASESEDKSKLSVWYDVRESMSKNNAVQSDAAYAPSYSNSINYVQAVKFDGTNGYFTVDGSVLNNTNYTIFVLERRESNKSGNYFIGDASSENQSTTNKNLVLGYSADGTVIHSQSSDNSYSSSISTYASSTGKARVFSFVHDSSVGKKTYINGLLAATSTDTNNLSGMNTLTIGKSYQGQIGEIVMFARALTDEERESVEDYLGKKWNSTILRSIGGSASSGGIGGSCVGGTVSDSGCLISCTVTAANGITATTVQDGSGSLTCNAAANFTGSLPYSCVNGVFQYTDKTSCSCATGYNLTGSTCTPINPSCSGGTESTTTISGITYKLHTFTSSGNLVCTAGGRSQVLVVAGGGGGTFFGGGGGGGGVVFKSSHTLTVKTYSVTVGSGGIANTSATTTPVNGGNSVFDTITTYGGGGGGNNSLAAGKAGGSGGGANRGDVPSRVGGAVITNIADGGISYGNVGGATANITGWGGAGGGGGAGSAGGQGGSNGTAAGEVGGSGGNGVSISITGTPTYYAGGGGGAVQGNLTPSPGGLGGGGAGGRNPVAGTDGYGGGGGGSTNIPKRGGSGVVIIRYAK